MSYIMNGISSFASIAAYASVGLVPILANKSVPKAYEYCLARLSSDLERLDRYPNVIYRKSNSRTTRHILATAACSTALSYAAMKTAATVLTNGINNSSIIALSIGMPLIEGAFNLLDANRTVGVVLTEKEMRTVRSEEIQCNKERVYLYSRFPMPWNSAEKYDPKWRWDS